MTKKRFDCVEMKRKAAAPINERLKDMTVEQQIAYWKERSEAFSREYGAGAFSGVGCGSSCPSGQHLVVSVTVTATQQFNTVTLFPGIPHTLSLSRVATMRAR